MLYLELQCLRNGISPTIRKFDRTRFTLGVKSDGVSLSQTLLFVNGLILKWYIIVILNRFDTIMP